MVLCVFQVFPDYRKRVLGHEAAHFLVGYLLGVPITGYSLSIGKEHVDFVEARIQQRLFQSKLDAQDIDQLAVVAMAGVASEAMEFEEIMGQTADLMDLQRLLNRSADKLSNMQQQDATRWAGKPCPPNSSPPTLQSKCLIVGVVTFFCCHVRVVMCIRIATVCTPMRVSVAMKQSAWTRVSTFSSCPVAPLPFSSHHGAT